MDVNKVLRELISRHRSYPAIKLAWECQLPLACEPPPVSPSHYIKELMMTTEERLHTMCQQQRQLEFWEPGMDFIVVPSVIVFQNFEPRKSYSIQISIRNISKKMQKIGLIMENTSEFNLSEKSVKVKKFAPGMIFKASVQFHPQEDRDFFHKLIVMTKDSPFAIPILGIGGRGILNPPDVIDFHKVPCKHLESKIIPLTNIGRKTARFLLSTEGPFCVSPERGVVDSKKVFMMQVSFYSGKPTNVEGSLTIQYENSEIVTVKLRGEAIDANLSIFPPVVTFDETYLGLKSFATVEIRNDTSVEAQFKWKQFHSLAESECALDTGHPNENRGYYGKHSSYRYVEAAGEKIVNIKPEVCVDCEYSGDVVEEEQDPLFPCDEFCIEPIWGKVQPHSSRHCILIFSPYKPLFYEKVAYCDITGRQERLTLHLQGESIKPKFTFGFDDNFVPLALTQGHTNQMVED